MKRRWWIGGAAVAVAIGIATAVAVGRDGPDKRDASSNQAGAGDAAAARDGGLFGKKGKDGKPDVVLEFTADEVVQPALATMPLVVQFSGPLVAPQTAVVRAKAPGTLLALAVGEGSRVKAGQALGRIDLSDLDTRWAERNAMLESARAQLAQAERTHQSNKSLADQQFISSIALESSRAALDTARAQVRAAQAQMETVSVTKRDAALVAPISGVVAKRQVVPGEKLAAEQPVLTIVDLAKLELAGTVGTHEVSLLAPGMPVAVQVEGFPQPVKGQLARIAPAAEAASRSIGVTIELDNPKETFRAGQYAMAQVVLADDARRLTLPAAAIGSTSGQEHVWVIENGTLARRAVTTGRRDPAAGRVELLQGIARDARVLGARFDNLREGAKATVAAGKSPPVASAAASSATLLK